MSAELNLHCYILPFKTNKQKPTKSSSSLCKLSKDQVLQFQRHIIKALIFSECFLSNMFDTTACSHVEIRARMHANEIILTQHCGNDSLPYIAGWIHDTGTFHKSVLCYVIYKVYYNSFFFYCTEELGSIWIFIMKAGFLNSTLLFFFP